MRRFAPPGPAAMLAWLNAWHPWSHNDHFHRWILANLPTRRGRVLDVGCGRGELLVTLAPHFDEVTGVDVDPAMCAAAARHTSDLGHVSVAATPWEEQAGRFDLITMVAVLHHLDVGGALARVRDLLGPGGRFLAVGLAPPVSATDHAWDLASALTNPLIGMYKHPVPVRGGSGPPPFPVVDPTTSFDDLRAVVETEMPAAVIRRRLAFRHTISWTKPGGEPAGSS